MEAISEKIRYSLSYRIRDTAGMGRRCPSEGSSLVIEDGRSTTPIPECTSIPCCGQLQSAPKTSPAKHGAHQSPGQSYGPAYQNTKFVAFVGGIGEAGFHHALAQWVRCVEIHYVIPTRRTKSWKRRSECRPSKTGSTLRLIIRSSRS